MTGPVDWTLLIFVVVAVGVGAGGSWWLSSMLTTMKEELRQELNLAVARAEATAEDTQRDLHAFKLLSSQTYMSQAGGSLAIDRVTAEVKGMRDDLKEEVSGLRADWKAELDKLGDRIERMESQAMHPMQRG